MEFWDDISKKVGDAANATVKGAEKLTGMAKIKYNIASKQGKLDKVFESIGRLRFDEFKNHVDNTEIIDNFLLEARALDSDIEALGEELSELSNAKRCVNCKAKISKEMPYCPKCGTKQPEDKEGKQ